VEPYCLGMPVCSGEEGSGGTGFLVAEFSGADFSLTDFSLTDSRLQVDGDGESFWKELGDEGSKRIITSAQDRERVDCMCVCVCVLVFSSVCVYVNVCVNKIM
jgi:hypothetical protein